MNLNNLTDEIRYKIDIADLISSFVPLKRAGKDFKALCPFHNEKTPSFMVSSEKQIFHCFGCGVGGDIFSFVMKYENVTFKEAIEILGGKAGVKVVFDRFESDAEDGASKLHLFRVNELAADYYHKLLFSKQGTKALDYLIKRGMKKDTINYFKIGYALPAWDGFLKEGRLKKIANNLLLKSGLIIKKEGQENSFYDRFRARIILPIYDIQNRVLGFSARVLDNSLPKYVNTPDTAVFSKGRMLYGLNFAKREIISKGKAVICEGQIDVISLVQEGIANSVASQGTAFTLSQARLLKRYAQEVVLAFDADEAGTNAQLKGIEILLQEGLAVKILNLPKGEDPDSLLRKIGKEKFEGLIAEALPFLDFKLKVLLDNNDISQEVGKTKAANEMLSSIKELTSSIIQDGYVQKLGEAIGVSEKILWNELKKLSKDKQAKRALSITAGTRLNKDKIPPGEKLLIRVLLEEKDNRVLNEILESISPEDFSDTRCRSIFQKMIALKMRNKAAADVLVENFPEEVKRVIAEILCAEIKTSDKEKLLKDNVKDVKKRSTERKIKELLKKMEEKSQDIEQVTLLQQEILDKKKELCKLN